MINLSKNRAISLTELMVASILVGIIMMGVMAFSVSLTQMESSSSRSTILAIQSVSILSSIRKDFNLATGDGGNWGLYLPPEPLVDPYYISIRRDNNETPDDYENDTWVVYYFDKVNFLLKRCEQTIALVDKPKETYAVPTANCIDPTYTDTEISIVANNVVDAKFELQINNLTYTPGGPLPLAESETESGKCVLYVKLTTRMDPSLPADMNKNPEFVFSTSIISTMHSW